MTKAVYPAHIKNAYKSLTEKTTQWKNRKDEELPLHKREYVIDWPIHEKVQPHYKSGKLKLNS